MPMEQINLHFTGDFHAITTANNLLAAMIDNHIYWGNELEIDTRRIVWRRALDMNDRALRNINIGLGGVNGGFAREDGFDTVSYTHLKYAVPQPTIHNWSIDAKSKPQFGSDTFSSNGSI